jgi:hypothetical protein
VTAHRRPDRLVNEAGTNDGPLTRVAEKLATLARPIQSGDVNLYLLYVFVAVVIAYAVYATQRPARL